jgi:hypothetical protein
VLITVKAAMEELAKGCPGSINEQMGDGLVPAISGTLKVHLSNANPEGFIDLVHCEIFFTGTTPTTGVLTVELRKG